MDIRCVARIALSAAQLRVQAPVAAAAACMQADAAKGLVAEMRASGLEPDIYTFGPLVTALGRAGLVDEAFQVRLQPPLQSRV